MQRTDAISRAVCRGPLHNVRLLVHGLILFANLAVTIARALSNTFAGIAPTGVMAFFRRPNLGDACDARSRPLVLANVKHTPARSLYFERATGVEAPCASMFGVLNLTITIH